MQSIYEILSFKSYSVAHSYSSYHRCFVLIVKFILIFKFPYCLFILNFYWIFNLF